MRPDFILLMLGTLLAGAPPRPDATVPELRQRVPVGALAPRPEKAAACPVELLTVARREEGGIRLLALARNRTKAKVVLKSADRCPAGPVRFTGLGADYDYDGVCSAGACPGAARPDVRWRLAPGQEVTLGSVLIHPAGDACNAPLPAGRLVFSFALDGLPKGCVAKPTTLVHRAPAREVAPRAAPPRCPERPACGLACDGPFARDSQGCLLCACAQ